RKTNPSGRSEAVMRFDRVLPTQKRVLAAVVERLLPTAPELPAETRPRVVDDATRFVVLEVESIPLFIRRPYLAAILGFDWLAVLRFARRYTRLGAEAQQSYLYFWTNSPIGPFRDFVKLIRGCALLAYFDHAEVRAALESGRRLKAGA